MFTNIYLVFTGCLAVILTVAGLFGGNFKNSGLSKRKVFTTCGFGFAGLFALTAVFSSLQLM